MKKIILLMFIFISYIITTNNIFADYNISDTSIIISKQSNITCKTGSDNVKVCYPDNYTWTTKTGSDGRVVAYPSGKESTKGLLYSSDELFININLNELELLKKLEKKFNNSKKYEEFLLYFIINNKNEDIKKISNNSINNYDYSDLESILACNDVKKNLENMINEAYKIVDLTSDKTLTKEQKINKFNTTFKVYEKDLYTALGIDGCLKVYNYLDTYYYTSGFFYNSIGDFENALMYFSESLMFNNMQLEKLGVKCENDSFCQLIIKQINNIPSDNNTHLYCGYNLYLDKKGDCVCNSGYAWNSNKSSCELVNNTSSTENVESNDNYSENYDICIYYSYERENLDILAQVYDYCELALKEVDKTKIELINDSIKRVDRNITYAEKKLFSGISYLAGEKNGVKYTYYDYLSDMGVINKKEKEEDYNLDKEVLRQEIAAVAIGVAGIEKKNTCNNDFLDVSYNTPNTWACYSVEALLDAGIIAKNQYFKPEAKISKAEAVGMMIKSRFGNTYSYNLNNSDSWQKQVVDFAVSKGIVNNFTDYDSTAKRGFVFEVGANAMNYYESDSTTSNDNKTSIDDELKKIDELLKDLNE